MTRSPSRWAKGTLVLGQTPCPPPSGPNQLNVALYPYVPRPQWFKDAIELEWYSGHPETVINWCDYDCYAKDPDPTLDIFAFDTIFAAYFAKQGYLAPIEPTETDFLPWATPGLTQGDQLLGVPYLGCMNILMYRDGDDCLSAPNLTVKELNACIGDSQSKVPQPPPGQGLLADLMGGTTDACYFLQTAMENAGQFPLYPPLPDPNHLAGQTLADLVLVGQTAGQPQASYCDCKDDRLSWFLAGSGRAMVGLTETFADVPPAAAADLRFRPLPIADEPINTISLFADALGVKAGLSQPKGQLAAEFVNVATSGLTLFKSIVAPTQDQAPQYLIPARASSLAKLASIYPTIYGQIQQLVTPQATTAAFRVSDQARNWLPAAGAAVRQATTGMLKACPTCPDPAFANTPAGIIRRGWN